MTARRKRGAVRQASTRGDARLLELVSQFRRHRVHIDALDRAQDHLHFQSPGAVAVNHEIVDLVRRCWRIREAVAALPSRSNEGLRAKSWLACWELSDGGIGELPANEDFGVGLSLARDILLGRVA